MPGLAVLLVLMLACGPLSRRQAVDQPERTLVSAEIVIKTSSSLVDDAYHKIKTLPGYHLVSRRIERDGAGRPTTRTIISQQDANGNIHALLQTSNQEQSELYLIDGQTYLFSPEYQGWVDLQAANAVPLSGINDMALDDIESAGNPARLLSQLAAIPIESGPDRVGQRTATRYRMKYVGADLSSGFEQNAINVPLELRGQVWIDNKTGALLKSEIRIYEQESRRLRQEYLVEVSQIGRVEPIALPEPIVDPVAIAAATATAQAWTILDALLDYGDERLMFEMIPMRVSQAANASPRRAEVQLRLRQLPAALFSESNAEPFLLRLREHLSLSIPERNLIVTSTGFRLETHDAQQRSLEVSYLFNADLEEFRHVELILAQPGNPIFVPVPVE